MLARDIAESLQLLRADLTKEAVAKWLGERLAERGWIKPEAKYVFDTDFCTDGHSVFVRLQGQTDGRMILPKGTEVVVLRAGDQRRMLRTGDHPVDPAVGKLFTFKP